MSDSTITLELERADAEVLLGVLASERYNAETEAVCGTASRDASGSCRQK